MSNILNYNLTDLKKTLPYAVSIFAVVVLANMSGTQERLTFFFQKLLVTWSWLVQLVGVEKVLELGSGIGYVISSILGVVLKKFLTKYPAETKIETKKQK